MPASVLSAARLDAAPPGAASSGDVPPDAARPPRLQRAVGEALVTLRSPAGPQGRATLARLRQQGSAKAILPRSDARVPEIVFLNTSGGLTGGDRLTWALTLDDRACAVATTQTAERAYAAGSAGSSAAVDVRLSVGADGWLDWLPQETILYDGAAVDRAVTLDLAPGAGCLFLESVVLGRHAMGETVAGLSFRDIRTIRQAATPIWMEPLVLDTRALARGSGPAMLGGARAFATLALVHPAAADLTAPLRAVLDEPGVEAAASALPGRLILRALAWDGLPLRRLILRALAVLRPRLPSAGPLPRVWQM